MGEQSWARTAEAVGAALDAGDPAGLGPLLAPDVRWHGGGPGGCHSRDDVLGWIAGLSGSGVVLRLRARHRVAHRMLLHLALSSGEDVHQMLVLDEDGRIVHMLDYADPAVAERDLTSPSQAPAVAVDRLVPFVDVADIEASIAFYRLLGFDVTGEYRPHDRRTWARLGVGGAELMLAEREEGVDAARQGVLFYLYTHDLAALREHLRAHGATPTEIGDGSPGPRRELRVDDPDGYCLMIAETG